MSSVRRRVSYLPEPQSGTSWIAETQPRYRGLILNDFGAYGFCEVPIGTLFDTVTVPTPVGARAMQMITDSGCCRGPVLHHIDQETYVFLLPPGTRAGWPDRLGSCAGHGDHATLLVPLPSSDGVIRAGRTWVIAPDGSGTLTDPETLHQALDVLLSPGRSASPEDAAPGERAARPEPGEVVPLGGPRPHPEGEAG